MRSRTPRIAACCLALALAGCRDDMYDQPRYEPLEAGSALIGPTSALAPPEGTVARQESRGFDTLTTGMKDGKLAEDLPFEFTKDVVVRGKGRYMIYCTPCHDAAGTGQGMIVKRGFPAPPSLHTDELKAAPLGHFFDVITHGHGAMYSYASRVGPRDRWAIATYIRALQLSRSIPASDLPQADRDKLREIK